MQIEIWSTIFASSPAIDSNRHRMRKREMRINQGTIIIDSILLITFFPSRSLLKVPSGSMPCSKQYNSQHALPICTPRQIDWPSWIRLPCSLSLTCLTNMNTDTLTLHESQSYLFGSNRSFTHHFENENARQWSNTNRCVDVVLAFTSLFFYLIFFLRSLSLSPSLFRSFNYLRLYVD